VSSRRAAFAGAADRLDGFLDTEPQPHKLAVTAQRRQTVDASTIGVAASGRSVDRNRIGLARFAGEPSRELELGRESTVIELWQAALGVTPPP
jgi:hypothetical protein